MQRETFRITSNLGQDVVKHKWNSAVRETEKMMQGIAKEHNSVYDLTSSESIKEGFYHVKGKRVWTSRKDRFVVVFNIVKE